MEKNNYKLYTAILFLLIVNIITAQIIESDEISIIKDGQVVYKAQEPNVFIIKENENIITSTNVDNETEIYNILDKTIRKNNLLEYKLINTKKDSSNLIVNKVDSEIYMKVNTLELLFKISTFKMD